MKSLFPERLERLDYFARWLMFMIGVPVAAAFLLPLAKYIAFPPWPLFAVLILLFLMRFPCADIPRLRSIGWSPWLVLLFLIPVVNFVVQMFLFFKPAQDAES